MQMAQERGIFMLRNVFEETLVGIKEANYKFPGKTPSSRSIARWASEGYKGCVLETCKIGNTRYTSTEAIERFIERINSKPEYKPTFPRLSEKEIDQKKAKFKLK